MVDLKGLHFALSLFLRIGVRVDLIGILCFDGFMVIIVRIDEVGGKAVVVVGVHLNLNLYVWR